MPAKPASEATRIKGRDIAYSGCVVEVTDARFFTVKDRYNVRWPLDGSDPSCDCKSHGLCSHMIAVGIVIDEDGLVHGPAS